MMSKFFVGIVDLSRQEILLTGYALQVGYKRVALPWAVAKAVLLVARDSRHSRLSVI
ncbi:MAG: hypothetical protein KBT86_01335 [Gammaproteobacteria bacterium]|nr:hypothetical protein [Gammaproteobacteria bacterium]